MLLTFKLKVFFGIVLTTFGSGFIAGLIFHP